MPGPAPKPADQRRRRNAAPQTVRLPASGRPGPPPAWPLATQGPGEAEAWAEAWSTPQSVEWERLGWVRMVARYVRVMVRAEQPDAPVMLMGECRQLEDRLGLTPMSLLRLRWEIGEAEEKRKGDGLVVVKPDRWQKRTG